MACADFLEASSSMRSACDSEKPEPHRMEKDTVPANTVLNLGRYIQVGLGGLLACVWRGACISSVCRAGKAHPFPAKLRPSAVCWCCRLASWGRAPSGV
jgi:hypothetical protein